ncbi:uncharacterized protein EAF01_004418 [Botrytis porri]|uniref:uncharacterized protein n=1 Tax=Botrytis porri TaxID=87229 RepID=UPI001901326D|nr:uncharacterized protein EAF01_004418 [Botrytis porri]KAF7908663.1 hypothetical protein EAF01_004418 [Botrytis porri]
MTSESSHANSRKTGSSQADSRIRGSHKSSRVESITAGNERRRSIESLRVNTRDLDIGGRNSPQPKLSPGDIVDPSVDTKLLEHEVSWAAIERFKKNQEQDVDESGSKKERRRRHESSRDNEERPPRVHIHRRCSSPPVNKKTTSKTTVCKYLSISREKKEEYYPIESHSVKHGHSKKLPNSDQRYRDHSRPSSRKEKDEKTINTEKSAPAENDVSSPKTSVSSKPKTATSSKHSASTHKSASVSDHKDKVSQKSSHHSSKSASSRKGHDGVDNEPSPEEPQALSEGSASGSVQGKPTRSNTLALDHHSLKSNLNVYNPNRGGRGTSTTAPSDNGLAERTQTGYGRGGHDDQPYLYDTGEVDHYKAPKSTSSKASQSTSVAALSIHAPSQRAPSQRAPSQRAPSQRAPSQRAPSERAPSQRAPSSRGEDADDQPYVCEDEDNQSKASVSTGRTIGSRRSHRS